MSEPSARPDLVVWPREARVAAVPGRAPFRRHEPLPGLAGIDWRLRRAWRRRQEEAFQRVAIAGGVAAAVMPRPGDITLGAVRAAFAAAREAAGEGAREVTPAQVLALLRGCYLAVEPARRLPVVALAAATAVRCGLPVHVACAGRDDVAPLVALLGAAVGDVAPVQALAESADDRALLGGAGPAVVVGTASALAHGWLRWGGEGDALARAAALLGGEDGARFSYAPLLLSPDGDTLLLEMVRRPLQLTSTRPDDAARFMQQVVTALAEFSEGREVAGGQLTPAGEAALAAMAVRAGGLWAVPALRARYAAAVLQARALQPDQHYVMENGRLQWRADPALLAGDPADAPVLELALRCQLGEPPAQRVRRRAWFTDFLAGYARLGVAGPVLADEAVDLWWLHGLTVIGNRARPLAVEWSPLPLTVLAAGPGPVALATRALAARPGLPDGLPCLETGAALPAAEGQGKAAAPRVLGLPVARRQLPADVSSIIIAQDDPQVPPPLLAATRLLSALGAPGRALLRLLGAWLLARSARQRFALRRSLLLRSAQERRTYAFTGEAGDS